MIRLHELSMFGVQSVCFNMREPDREEIFNLLDHDSPVKLAYQVIEAIRMNGGRGRVAFVGPTPVAVVGFAMFRPGVWQIILFGTDRFKEAAIHMLRWIRENADDLVTNHGGRRLQCESRQGHDEAHAFLRRLGARAEGPLMRMYGKDGSSYQRYVWIVGDNDHVLLKLKRPEDVLLSHVNA